MEATAYRDRRGRTIFLDNEVCIIAGDLKSKKGSVLNVTEKGDVSIEVKGRNMPVMVYCKDIIVVIPDLDLDFYLGNPKSEPDEETENEDDE